MIKSELILPIRFYNDLYEQNRFSKENAGYEQASDLNYPQTELPHFQILRNKSVNTIEAFYLREVCSDKEFGYYKVVPKGVDIFSPINTKNFFGNIFPIESGGIFDNGVDPPEGVYFPLVDFDPCGGLSNLTIDPYTTASAGPSTYAELIVPVYSVARQKFKIIVDTFYKSPGSTFAIDIKADTQTGTLLQTINGPGTYIIDIPGASLSSVSISFPNYASGDRFKISYIQSTALYPIEVAGPLQTDIELSNSNIKIIPLTNGKDVLAFAECNGEGGDIPPGQYYYIVKADSEIYFSEVFNIKPQLDFRKYFKLEWNNDCNIASVLYRVSVSELGCEHKNVLYLNAELFKPQYLTVNDVDQNGAGDEISKFKRWQKTRNLDIICSEFLADALGGIFLHSNITLREPLNVFQEESTAYEIEKVVAETQDVLNELKQRVILTMTLSNKHVKTGCCDDSIFFNCDPEKYIAGATCSGFDYTLILDNTPTGGLRSCATNDLINVLEDDLIYYDPDGNYWQIYNDSGIWKLKRRMPHIQPVTITATEYIIDINLFPNTFGTLQYNKNGAGWVGLGLLEVDETGDITYIANKAFINIGGAATTLDFRVTNFTLGFCDFGTATRTALP